MPFWAMNLASHSMDKIIADRFTAYFTGRLPFCMVTTSARKAPWLHHGGIQGLTEGCGKESRSTVYPLVSKYGYRKIPIDT